ncbi:MAG: hypothetical protein HKN48_00850 [Flavobacteriaceae bacterium]|nr:hypothetical protein [Flavobacteriaceae bacterium]
MGEDKEKRSSILNAISDWLKLVGLIVLVVEALLLLAMTLTPADDPIFKWYPITMILLALVVIVALFFDRRDQRDTDIKKIHAEADADRIRQQTIGVAGNEVSVDSSSIGAELDEGVNDYTNSLLGYSLSKPEGDGWNDPESISYSEFIRRLYSKPDWTDEEVESNTVANSPYGNLLFRSNILEIQFGKNFTVDFTEDTTTDMVEYTLMNEVEQAKARGEEVTEEEIKEARMELNQTNVVPSVSFTPNLRIMTMKKENLNVSFLDGSLPNLFLHLSTSVQEHIESLDSDEDSILWTTANKLMNVQFDGEDFNAFYIYRLYRLLESEKYIYLVAAQWSPQLKSAVFAWDSLKKSFESFKVKA